MARANALKPEIEQRRNPVNVEMRLTMKFIPQIKAAFAGQGKREGRWDVADHSLPGP